MDGAGAGRKGIALTDRQRISWLRLIRTDNVGPATFRDLINHFGSAEQALGMLPELSRRGGSARPVRIATVEDAERELDVARRFGARFVGVGEPEYPYALRQIEAAPPLLAIKGEVRVTTPPAVGMVGSRNASISGAKFAAQIARALGTAGYTVVSGMARGIDAAAHQASLPTGTIAAMAGGLDRPYPPENQRLFEEITSEGLAVSEMPFGWEARARDFPRRNRLIAGIGLGVIVVEAASRSGSLITARLAGEFGRLVFAVPGSPLDPRCEGTNSLLKQGAIVTTGPDDVLEALAPLSQMELPILSQADEPVQDGEGRLPELPDDSARARIVDALGPTPVEIDDIIRHVDLDAATVYLALLELDLAGRLHRQPGGLVSLAMSQ